MQTKPVPTIADSYHLDEPVRVKMPKGTILLIVCMFFCVFVLPVVGVLISKTPDLGYYRYQDRWYYYDYDHHSWYSYQGGWSSAQPDRAMTDRWTAYFVSDAYDRSMEIGQFTR